MKRKIFLIICGFILTACTVFPTQQGLSTVTTAPLLGEPSRTPFEPQATTTAVISTPTSIPVINVSLPGSIPPKLAEQITLPEGMQWVQAEADASLTLTPTNRSVPGGAVWVYALAAPFPTILDEVASNDLQAVWRGEDTPGLEGFRLYISPSTQATLTSLWGEPVGSRVQVEDGSLVEAAWANQPALAIIPFEDLEPRWKVLRLDGQSPISKSFDPATYPLTVTYAWQSAAQLDQLPALPAGNRDPGKMTVITMTGVTALVRATGAMMDLYGVTFPGKDIRDWMLEADFTHVSNEVSFDPTCPKQDPNAQTLRFCSQPKYIELLEDVGVDIVELTGNHLMDWRQEGLPYTMELYRQRGWITFGGGDNLENARQPALFEHNGNRFALIGCNPAGPGGDWAGEGNPGSAPCDWEWMKEQIRQLSSQGYLVIATLQYYETYVPTPSAQQVADFESLSEAGAVIVNGSQAHFPQGFEFYNGRFIHYGLGNLFFDQMDYPVVGTRREFLDRNIFYDGKHISTELLTALLENYAKPRPMTQEERNIFLQDMFTASGW